MATSGGCLPGCWISWRPRTLHLDYFVLDRELQARWDNCPHLEAEYTTRRRPPTFWACGIYDWPAEMRLVALEDELDDDMVVIKRRTSGTSTVLSPPAGEMLEERASKSRRVRRLRRGPLDPARR